jgi:hypothetical protein
VVYGQNLLGAAPVIDTAAIALVSATPTPGVEKRAELYLGAVIRRLGGKLMGRFSLTDPMIKVASWCLKDNDSVALATYLKGLGAFEDPQTNAGQEMLLLAHGHLVYEKMAGHRASSS